MDPSRNLDLTGDILVRGGRIAAVGPGLEAGDALVIEGKGLVAAPGLVDIHVHFRDPGQTYKEDILTGAAAAAAGGVTSVCCMPNTKPAADSPETVRYIVERAKGAKARVYPVGAVTLGLRGETLTPAQELQEAGAVALSDDGRPVERGAYMLEALREGRRLGMTVACHCEDLSIIGGGIMNEGEISRRLGVKGMDRASEDSDTARVVALAAASGTAVHICHVSTKGSVDIIRDAKARGVRVTAETGPHYLWFTDEKLLSRDANFRMNPPLRTKEDVESLIAGLLDGTIDAIATDHAPHSREEKADFLTAPNGVVGLETSFAACYTKLVLERGMALMRLLELMSAAPARIMGLPAGTLDAGAPADIALLDLERKWTVDPERFQSKGRNTVFAGAELTGCPVLTVLGGEIVWQRDE